MAFGLVAILLCGIAVLCSAQNPEIYRRVLKIPNKVFDGRSELFCTSQPVDANQFFVEFQPIIEHHDAIHHVSIDMCEEAYSEDYVWDCSEGRICKPGTGHREGVFTWGREANGWKLANDTGVAIGHRNKVIILQVHCANVFEASEKAETGMEVTLRSTRPKYEAGLAITGNMGRIPPKVTDYYTETACEWRFTSPVTVMSYSIHTHTRGKVVSAYIIRNGVWHEIGRGDPKYPELVMDITHKNLTIQPGDIVASRCTYENKEDRYVPFGHGASSEMCNFHIHYFYPTYSDYKLRHVECSADAETFHWKDHLVGIPTDASDGHTNTDQSKYIQNDHWIKHLYKTV